MSVVKHQNRYNVETLLKTGLAAPVKQLRCLLGLAFLAASSATFSAAIETEEFTVDPIPMVPSASDMIFLQVADIKDQGALCLIGLSLNGVFIDTINKILQVSVKFTDLLISLCPPPLSFKVPVGYLNDSGDYEVSIYREVLAEGTLPFQQQNLIGSFNLTVRPNNDNAHHEIPSEGSTQSGIGLISGWACDAIRVEVSIDGGERIPVAYGTSRQDTLTVCESEFSGYGMVIAWGLLGAGNHRLQTFVDGVEIADVEFEVSGLGEGFVKGLTGSYLLEDFPTADESVTVEWSEPHQNFIVVEHNN